MYTYLKSAPQTIRVSILLLSMVPIAEEMIVTCVVVTGVVSKLMIVTGGSFRRDDCHRGHCRRNDCHRSNCLKGSCRRDDYQRG